MTEDIRRRILVVEDEALIAIDLCERLNASGFDVVGPSGTLAEARNLARNWRIDFALLDVNLHNEMVYPLAADLAARGIPFAFLTSSQPIEMPEHWRSWLILQKPTDVHSLVAQLDGMLARLPSSPAVSSQKSADATG